MSDATAKPSTFTAVGEIVIAAIIVLGVGLFLWRWSSPVTSAPKTSEAMLGPSAEAQPLANRLMIGRPEAPVVIVIVSEFQCPFCARFATTTFPQLRESLIDTGRVAVYFRHFPLEGHQMAGPAAELAECAGRAGKFWSAHDALFAAKGKLTHGLFDQTARSAGLGPWKPGVCPAGDVVDTVAEDKQWADSMGLGGTPFFVLGKRTTDGRVQFRSTLQGALPLDAFRRAVDLIDPQR
jgi:protein-disulfide isomerase